MRMQLAIKRLLWEYADWKFVLFIYAKPTVYWFSRKQRYRLQTFLTASLMFLQVVQTEFIFITKH